MLALAGAFLFRCAGAEAGIYVAKSSGLLAVDPDTGNRKIVSGQRFGAGLLALSADGQTIYLTEQNDRAVYAIDVQTHAVSMASGPGRGDGPPFSNRINGLVADGAGAIFVGDGSDGGSNAVLRIDIATGNRSVTSAGTNSPLAHGAGRGFGYPFGLAMDTDGQLLVADALLDAVLKVDPATGNRSVLSGDPIGSAIGSGPDLVFPVGVARRSDGKIIVSDNRSQQGGLRLVEITTPSGNRTSDYENYWYHSWQMAVGSSGSVYSALPMNGGKGSILFSTNTSTGTATQISSSCLLCFSEDNCQSGETCMSFASPVPANHEKGQGPPIEEPIGLLASEDETRLYVSDNKTGSLFVIDRASGDRHVDEASIEGNGPSLTGVRGIVELPNGDFLVADESNAVLRLDRTTGERTVLSAGSNGVVVRGAGPKFLSPYGIALDNDGDLVVADLGTGGLNGGRLIRVDLDSGDREIISDQFQGNGPALAFPYGVAVTSSGTILVTDSATSALLKVDPATGNRQVLSTNGVGDGPIINSPRGVAIVSESQYLVASFRSLLAIDAVTGARTTVSSSTVAGEFDVLDGVAVESPGDTALVVDSATSTISRVKLSDGSRTVVSGTQVGSGSPFFFVGGGDNVRLIAVSTSDFCGDANRDGTQTVSDALVILRSAVGASPCSHEICDVNDNGSVTASDALIVLRKSVGVDVALDCPFA